MVFYGSVSSLVFGFIDLHSSVVMEILPGRVGYFILITHVLNSDVALDLFRGVHECHIPLVVRFDLSL